MAVLVEMQNTGDPANRSEIYFRRSSSNQMVSAGPVSLHRLSQWR